jgi:cytochrome c-type biogenesis protein CcmH/NrfG
MAPQDFYETLQVHPKADAAAIQTAYTRLRDQYDPARLEGVAEELVALAQSRRADVEQAYATLVDPAKRAVYDAALRRDAGRGMRDENLLPHPASRIPHPSPGETALDYRPLPPAGKAERTRGFEAQPKVPDPAGRTRLMPLMAAMVIAAAVLLPALAIGFVLTGGGSVASVPQTTPTVSPLDQFEPLIAQAQRVTEERPEDPQAWADLGNLLYDSAQIVREQAPNSTLYQQRLPRWLDAMAAYRRALELQPENHAVRADLGASACFYGATAPDPNYVAQGFGETETAIAADPQNPRVLLSHGYCLVSMQPPRTAEAIAGWEQVLDIVPADSPLAGQAQALIERYGAQ